MKINELHDKLFEVLCTIDDICTAEGIKYFLDSGTEIGSVREKDFIPWDDDMDIKIMAEDYWRFEQAMEKHLPEHMHLVKPEIFSPHFYDFILRIYDDRWLIRKETLEDCYYKNYQNRVGTDIFVLIGVPDNFFIKKYLQLKVKILYGLGMAYRYKIDFSKYSLKEFVQVMLLSTFGKLIGSNQIYKSWWNLFNRYNIPNSKYRLPINYTLKNVKCFPSEWYEESSYGEIRGRKFPIPKGYTQELTYLYGDYLTPPKDRSIYNQHLAPEDLENNSIN